MFRVLLFFIFLTGCAVTFPTDPNTTWVQSSWQDNLGVIALATELGKSHLCTGVLISPKVVVSAAHCYKSPNETYIVYGCDNIKHDECIRVKVESIHNHPQYKFAFNSGNDIAVFLTEEPIDLPPVKIANKKHYKDEVVKAVGFGARNNNSGIIYDGIGTVKDEYLFEISAKLKKQTDPNPGDSGGPILILENGEYKVLGILSRIILNKKKIKKNGKDKYVYTHSGVGVYTKILPYTPWINEYKMLP